MSSLFLFPDALKRDPAEKLQFTAEFKYEDFCTGIRAGDQFFHLKLVDEKDPSIAFVDDGEHFHLYFETEGVTALAAQLKERGARLIRDIEETPRGTRELVIYDDQGHTLYFGEPLK